MTVNTERYLEFVNTLPHNRVKITKKLLYTVYKNSKVKDFLPKDCIANL